MVIKELREAIEFVSPNALLFDNPSFDGSIIGIADDGRLIYSYTKMILELAADDNISASEAEEFIAYNTLRSLPYQDAKIAPVIVYPIPYEKEENVEVK